MAIGSSKILSWFFWVGFSFLRGFFLEGGVKQLGPTSAILLPNFVLILFTYLGYWHCLATADARMIEPEDMSRCSTTYQLKSSTRL